MALTDDLIVRCKTRFKDPNNDILSDADWLAYLNDAYDEINGASPWWPWLELQSTALVIAANANTVSLPTDAWRVSAVWNSTDFAALVPLQGRAAYRYQYPTGSADPGTPTAYRIRNRTLEVWPFADHSVSLIVDYYAVPALLDDSPDSDPVWPRQFNQALIEGALSRAYMDDGNSDWASQQREVMKGIVENMARDLLGPREESYPGITDDWY